MITTMQVARTGMRPGRTITWTSSRPRINRKDIGIRTTIIPMIMITI